MESTNININCDADGRELRSKNVQIRLLGHCIICLSKVSTRGRGQGTSKNFDKSTPPQPEIAPKSVVSTSGFLKTFNQVWAVLQTKWKEKNGQTSNNSLDQIDVSLENILQGSLVSNVSFSKPPTICHLCCDKVLAVENLMKAVRQQVREINTLLEEGRKRQDGGLGDFENNLREEGLEENVIRATLQFVGIFGSCSEKKDDFRDLTKDDGTAAAVDMEYDEENSLNSQIDSDDNKDGETGGSAEDDDDGDPLYVKSEEDESTKDNESEVEMDGVEEEDKKDPDYDGGKELEEAEMVPCTCGKSFKNRGRLLAHMQKNKRLHPVYGLIKQEEDNYKDNEDNKFICTCGKRFASSRRRNEHVRRNKSTHPGFKLFGSVDVEGRRRPTCELCGERVSFSDVVQHYTDHLNGQAEWLLRCPNEQCHYTGVISNKWGKHLTSSEHKECNRIWREKGGPVCDTCGFKGSNMLVIRNHVKDKHENGRGEEKKWRCPISDCGKMFCVRESVPFHMSEHRYLPITQQICDKCGKDLKIGEMEGHLKEEHGIKEVIGCGQCEMRFSGRDEMVEHLYEHRGVGIFCDICGENKFTRYVDFREHYFGVHKLCPKKYKCGEGECDKWFWRLFDKKDHEMRSHMRSNKNLVKKKEEKKFGCDVCDIKFEKEYNLINHKIKVHGEDPLRCDICGDTFNEKLKFNKHMKEHAGIPVQKEWRCEVEGCGKIFKKKQNWTRHKEVGHGGVKKHVCEICGKGYYDAGALREHHDIIHLGKRPWVCDECGERFGSSTVLKRHKLIHTGERPFGCEVCGQRFRHREVLRRHLVGHEEKGANFKPNGPMKQIRKRKAE